MIGFFKWFKNSTAFTVAVKDPTPGKWAEVIHYLELPVQERNNDFSEFLFELHILTYSILKNIYKNRLMSTITVPEKQTFTNN